MSELFKTLHVLAVIIAIGPVVVAGSLFPRYTREAFADLTDRSQVGTLRILHRICQVYSGVGILIPIFGYITATVMEVVSETWLLVSMVMTVISVMILMVSVLPTQQETLLRLDALEKGEGEAPTADEIGKKAKQLAMSMGIVNLLWLIIAILMVVRPGGSGVS